ncbi:MULTISPECIES: peptidase [Sphingomonadales]|uniref:peptidase n=2 Tax=Alphaproteobacteria TaxID=28211 RepID=UPI00336BE116
MAARAATLDRRFDQRAVLTMHGVTKPVAVARPRSQGRPLRALLLLHRWMGIVIGTVMTLWCLTGFVMLFVDYPRLLPAGQLRALSPFHLPADGELAGITLPADTALASARLEMVVGKAVLRVVPEKGDGRAIWQMRASPLSYDLASGAPLAPLSRQDLAKVGMEFGRNFGIDGLVAAITPISVDQWTVQAFRANRPLYRVDYADAAGSSAYIAGLTGEVVQKTTRFERFWGWLGAVPHWLYPTVLRQNPAAWSQVVIWTSLTGCFLTVTGIWVGISRLRRGKDGAIGSPYRGLWWWHHMAGLAFGLLALTWVGSGLFSMSPWGLFDSDAGSVERQRLAGLMRWTDMRAALANLNRLPIGTVRVESAPLGGKTMLIAIAADGRRVRIDGWGRPAILTRADVAAALRNGPRVVSLSLLSEGDSYYYAHKEPVRLPVWRAVLADPQATHLYIDAASGTLLRAVDGTGRAERWLWKAPHSFDLPGLRHSALRYIFVLPLLAAVTLVCGSGAWMGMRKLGRDLQRTRQGIRRRLSRRPSFLRSRSQS